MIKELLSYIQTGEQRIYKVQFITIKVSTRMEFCLREVGEEEPPSVFKDYLGMRIWEMRHLAVSKFIEKHAVRKVLDIACSNGKLLQRLSRESTMELLVGIDIDEEVLQEACHTVKSQPIQEDIKYCRQKPLNVGIYHGDATVPLPQLKEKGFELVTMIQFIQHLELDKLPSLNDSIFDYFRPKYVIITTPNREFNDFFDLKEGEFRHWDHRYEWNRKQFEDYCTGIANKYHYTFEIFGVGEHVTDGSKGFCSQGVAFTRVETIKDYEESKSLFFSMRKQPENSDQFEKAFFSETKLNKISFPIHHASCKQLHSQRFPFWENDIDEQVKYALDRALRMRRRYSNEQFKFIISWEILIGDIKASRIGDCLLRSFRDINRKFLEPYLSQMKSFVFTFERQSIVVEDAIVEESQSEDEQEMFGMQIESPSTNAS